MSIIIGYTRLQNKLPKIKKEKGRTSATADSPLRSDLPETWRFHLVAVERDAHDVVADPCVCPIDV